MTLDARDSDGEAVLAGRRWSNSQSSDSPSRATRDAALIDSLVEGLGGRHVSDGSARWAAAADERPCDAFECALCTRGRD